jgi:hypothetical protein
MVLLIRNQAALLSQLTEDHKRLSKNEQDLADIKGDLAQIKAILLRHDQVLADLPEAIQQKVGFKVPPNSHQLGESVSENSTGVLVSLRDLSLFRRRL